VRALGDHLAERFGVEAVFLDAPTGYCHSVEMANLFERPWGTNC